MKQLISLVAITLSSTFAHGKLLYTCRPTSMPQNLVTVESVGQQGLFKATLKSSQSGMVLYSLTGPVQVWGDGTQLYNIKLQEGVTSIGVKPMNLNASKLFISDPSSNSSSALFAPCQAEF